MILNEIERAVICGKQEYRTNADFIDAIEAAVLAKLSQGVDMPEPVAWMTSYGNVCRDDNKKSSMPFDDKADYVVPLYTAAAIAAARVQGYDECMKLCDPDALGLEQGDDCATGVYRVEKAIRALKGGAA